ncbi:MAG: YbbR-like domain-containing protein [Gemmatimonadota bacterium]|nr:YbbR-like domain-containing protein [Gemmatimonadota bacterium]
MNWRRLLLDNLGFKLSALVIVALLWISVTADERQAQPVSTRVAYEVADSTWVLVEGPSEVSTTFQGRNRELLGLLMEEPVVTVVIDSVLGPDMRIPLPLSQVAYNRDLGVVPSFITPSALDLRFERRIAARVAVIPDVDAMPAAGFTVLSPVLVDPDSVTVRGPESWIADLKRITTRPVELEALSTTVMRDVGLLVPPNVQGVDVSPASVVLTVNLDSLIVRRRRVPVRLRGAAASVTIADPDTVAIVVRGAASIVEATLDATSELVIDVPTAPEQAEQRPLSVTLQAGGPVAAEVDPPNVTLRPRT